MMTRSWTTLCAVAMLAVPSQLPRVAEPHLDADDLAVIEAALRATVLAETRRMDASRSRDVLLIDETLVFCTDVRRDIGCMRPESGLPSGLRGEKPLPLPRPPIAAVKLVSHHVLNTMFHAGGPDAAWTTFHQKFPNTFGFAGVSAPVYESGVARVYVTLSYGSLGGKGWMVRVVRDAGRWRVDDTRMIWIS